MKIRNDIPVTQLKNPTHHRPSGIQIKKEQQLQSLPSLQKAIAAYSIIHEAHQLVTMALNVSYELIQKAFSSQTERTEILSKIAEINNYFKRLSPVTVSIPPAASSDTIPETSTLLDNLETALKNNDMQKALLMRQTLETQAQKLSESNNHILKQLQLPGNSNIHIENLKNAIITIPEKALLAHNPLEYENIARLLM